MPEPIPIFFGTIRKCRFVPDNPERYIVYLSGIDGKRVTVKIDKEKKRRSNNQNRYLWGVVYKIISDFTGFTAEESHEAMKMLFLKKHSEKGYPDTVRSTTSLNTSEMEEYLENIRRFAAEKLNGAYIPLPNEVDFD